MKITDKTAKALSILEKSGRNGLLAKEFVLSYYGADHEINKRMSNIGHGATRGVGGWMWAGRYLSKLVKVGLVSRFALRDWAYCITEKGKEELKKYNIKNVKNSK